VTAARRCWHAFVGSRSNPGTSSAHSRASGNPGQKAGDYILDVPSPFGGSARSFHISGTTLATLLLMTDAAPYYKMVGKKFASHGRVEHAANEYVRREGERVIHTNTVEGYFSIFKRGMKGIYQHCSEKHLHRYLSEYDFRYTTTASSSAIAMLCGPIRR